jgi:hypothetical protein
MIGLNLDAYRKNVITSRDFHSVFGGCITIWNSCSSLEWEISWRPNIRFLGCMWGKALSYSAIQNMKKSKVDLGFPTGEVCLLFIFQNHGVSCDVFCVELIVSSAC